MIEEELRNQGKAAEAIAREAGLLLLGSYRKAQEVRHKANVVDLVTQTDLASEELIRRRLAQHFPGYGLIAEEGARLEAEGESSAIWVVDPLDGTTNFAHGHPFFCVSMALLVNDVLTIGVIHTPVLGWTWTALDGLGAWLNGAPIHVSETETLEGSLCASGFPYDRWTAEDNNSVEWSAMIRRAQGVRRCGSAALDLALLADGTFDGYWEKRLNPWDMAAGTLIVEAAGGRVSDLEGARVPPWPEVIVATNGFIHTELLEALRLND